MKELISNNVTEAREIDVVEHSALREKRVMSKPIANQRIRSILPIVAKK